MCEQLRRDSLTIIEDVEPNRANTATPPSSPQRTDGGTQILITSSRATDAECVSRIIWVGGDVGGDMTTGGRTDLTDWTIVRSLEGGMNLFLHNNTARSLPLIWHGDHIFAFTRKEGGKRRPPNSDRPGSSSVCGYEQLSQYYCGGRERMRKWGNE